MPKRLSDITHAFEHTSEDLEDAQHALTHASEAARAKVDACAQSHHAAYDDLHRYLKDHQDAVIVAGDCGYRWERGQIARMKIVWAHHVWVDDPAPAPTYRVPPITGPEALRATVADWEPRAGEADLSAEGEAALDAVRATWEEPNGAPVTIKGDTDFD